MPAEPLNRENRGIFDCLKVRVFSWSPLRDRPINSSAVSHEHNFPFNFVDDGSCICRRFADRVQLSTEACCSGPCGDGFWCRYRSGAASRCYFSNVVIRRRCSRGSRLGRSDRYDSTSATQPVWRMGQRFLRSQPNQYRDLGSIDANGRMFRSFSYSRSKWVGSQSHHRARRSDSIELRYDQDARIVVSKSLAVWLAVRVQ